MSSTMILMIKQLKARKKYMNQIVDDSKEADE